MLLEISDVGFEYPGRPLFDGVTLSLEQGASVAIMGPSGVGKSTLLTIVAGYASPTHGVVSLDEAARTQGVEYVIQSAPLLNHRSTIDNACLAQLVREGDSELLRAGAQETLAQLGLADRALDAAHRLSGGERQRVAIARAVLARPALILADEPTASLDIGLRDRVMDVLLDTSALGTSLMVATHDPAVAQRCDFVVNLSQLARAA